MNTSCRRPNRAGLLAMIAALCVLFAWPHDSEAAAVRLMLSSRADASSAGADVYVVTYDSFDDLMASPPAGGPVQAFSGINVSSQYIASGLTYDGKYRLMLSRRDDSVAAGSDVFVVTYDTFDDLIASPPAGGPTQGFSGINVSSQYIASGLAFEFDRDPGPGTVAEPPSAALTLAALALLAGASTRARRAGRSVIPL